MRRRARRRRRRLMIVAAFVLDGLAAFGYGVWLAFREADELELELERFALRRDAC